jgi:DNA-binding MarR family transcriptional regulator
MEHCNVNGVAKVSNDNAIHQADLIRGRLGSALPLVDELNGNRKSAAAPESQAITEHNIRALLGLRRHRANFFDDDLFADPAWDILLELYAAELGQQRLSITNLCAVAAVPATTALRWIALLEKKTLISRRPDPMDGRRIFVALSADGLQAMEDYFRTVSPGATII